MEKLTDTGLVIKEQNIGEADRLITVLTRHHGLVRAFSRGAKNAKSKKLASTSLLAYSDFTFSKTRETYSVEDAQIKEVFFELRADIAKTALAQYFCELANDFCDEGYETEEVLRLFLNALYFLKSGKRETLFVKAVTELRLMCLSGYMPALVACDNCGEYETPVMFFSYEEGKLTCENCRPAAPCVELSSAVVKAMRFVALSDFDKIFSFELKDGALERFCAVAEGYLLHKTQRKFKTLDFFKVIND